MNSVVTPRQPPKKWRGVSLFLLGLLPAMALFHLVMWYGFTQTLFGPKTGSLKRTGYLVGMEDCMSRLVEQEPQSGFTTYEPSQLSAVPEVPVMIYGDSFSPSLAKAFSLETKKPVGFAMVNWGDANGMRQLKDWLADDWLRTHQVKTVIVERVEYAWLNDFADEGDSHLRVSWAQQMAGQAVPRYQKAKLWTFANNGNFKVVINNLGYLFSPNAFGLSETWVVPLKQKFFNCSYGNKLLLYGFDSRGALTSKNGARLDQALGHLKELAEICRQRGIEFHLVVAPVKSYLYYDWVERPSYPNSRMLEALQERATPYGYVDLKQPFHRQLEAGFQDLYYPDDFHWNFPAAQIAAKELVKAGAGSAR